MGNGYSYAFSSTNILFYQHINSGFEIGPRFSNRWVAVLARLPIIIPHQPFDVERTVNAWGRWVLFVVHIRVSLKPYRESISETLSRAANPLGHPRNRIR